MTSTLANIDSQINDIPINKLVKNDLNETVRIILLNSLFILFYFYLNKRIQLILMKKLLYQN